ncbi:S8 family serine peptidase [Nocardioides sp. AX2bis]|uniref:S8 family serine peptidase n=1 Tax=Nocardioides sp. AX2bis TaxID=2653157 RepID=UPI0012F06C81|nr:S8 family serine peptidase [Nocardioides sp. AX2bis]VXA96597.1 Peptidase S8 and S53, subtilisin, kexin [Nocardioides sp. AX2bis]
MPRTAGTTGLRRARGGVAVALVAALTGVLAGGVGATLLAAAPAGADHGTAVGDPSTRLHLVTLTGPGTSGRSGSDAVAREQMRERQDAVLAAVGAPAPVYRWTTALDGVAVRLDRGQAGLLAADPRVTLVEADDVRPLAGAPAGARAAAARPSGAGGGGPAAGGRGTVVGVVDSGIAPRSASFATLPSLGREPAGFTGGCAGGAGDAGWAPSDCGGKIAGAQWFVEGFGRESLRSGSSISPRDDLGHGTQMASIAAGNAGVPVRVPGQLPTTTGGQAPDARLAVYKACWSAPDPDDDGCSTADLVTAVDRAVEDGVDVLSLSVGGGTAAGAAVDTLERALLGAAEADVAVLAAAGNDPALPAAHDVPWVTTVGAAPGSEPVGLVRVVGGPTLRGLTAARDGLPPGPLVLGRAAAAEGTAPGRAAVCAPGSLDASVVSGAVVVCERGSVGRVDKSGTVALADGAGMVLVNRSGRSLFADFHSVPTVHLAAADGRTLLRALRRTPQARAALVVTGRDRASGPAARSAAGDPAGAVLKPDLTAPGSGLLGAVPTADGGPGWSVVAGTSAATAWTAGATAALRAREPGWDAVRVRSALATRALAASGGSPLTSGAGGVDADRAADVRLDYPQPVGGYRAWLERDGRAPNTPSVLLAGGDRVATRTIRNTADEALYFSSEARAFSTAVQVRPLAVRLGPGETATWTITRTGPARADDGYVVWRGGDRSRSRVPVVVAP